jgi:succinate-semialdehyde dehydrogenase/glutarate-semialdehyde dehydrogenase
MRSVNPATGETLREYEEHSDAAAAEIVEAVAEAWRCWRRSSFEQRRQALESLAATLLGRESEYARLITLEMGKTIGEAHVEIQKCARICRFFAQHGEDMLADELVNAESARSVVSFDPLGPLLAIMPWNFPFWQVFRFAAPALMAGNVCVLKHASNVSGCALAIEEAFRIAGLPENVLRTVLVPGRRTEALIAHPAVRGVAVTGSAEAGASIAAVAGRHLKKTVLELGGSDPFIVLEDANIELCAAKAVRSRMKVAGQACIAAKRLIAHERVAERFAARFVELAQGLRVGDPLDPEVDMGPLARADLADKLEEQTQGSLALGARLATGGRRIERPGFFFEPTLLTEARKGMPVFDEEVFGPVAALVTVRDEEEAVLVANQSEFGLGASVWTRDPERGEALARRLEAGIVHVNGITRSDPRLPFGGIKRSGWGRELSWYGIREFVNVKAIMVS